MEKRQRSPNYPALSLREAIDRAAQLYKNQRTHAAPREVVAKSMGFQSLNGASATAISALHKYGLLERAGDEVKISDRAMRILHPQSSEERAQAIRDAAAEPALFAELNGRFPGSMPSEELLRNYLIRNGFAAGAVSAVILSYRDTQELVEREGGGYDSPSVTQAASEVPVIMQPSGMAVSTQMGVPKVIVSQEVEREISRYNFEDGGYVRLTVVGDIDTETALDEIEFQIKQKRAEIARRRTKAASATPEEKKNEFETDPSS